MIWIFASLNIFEVGDELLDVGLSDNNGVAFLAGWQSFADVDQEHVLIVLQL
jgi:hypothetical protein